MTNPNIREIKPVLQLRHIYNAHKALLRWLTLQKSLNLLYFCQRSVFQLSNSAKHWATSQHPTPMPTSTHVILQKLYFPHHTHKQLILESDGSPPLQ